MRSNLTLDMSVSVTHKLNPKAFVPGDVTCFLIYEMHVKIDISCSHACRLSDFVYTLKSIVGVVQERITFFFLPFSYCMNHFV